ncbi:HSF-type DNA-binding [Seminavis robusta]|uniref:HSF-type DNA-binding n=1 Tax=Seminavis robusta TaxID=568900 RepID=A0A9N8DTK9_9STRA|nr:HSF-type DNA-binding [Seminavis robusta]|eukprot:Sro279_g106880.1 HSF-type DNA-binding (410) ;mRNA; r:59490-60909
MSPRLLTPRVQSTHKSNQKRIEQPSHKSSLAKRSQTQFSTTRHHNTNNTIMHSPVATSPSKATITTTMADKSDTSNGNQLSLPQTLMKLLIEGNASEAIWWLPGGNEFAINAALFPSQVLEVYFPGCKYASFIRRLHKMGFSRETRALKKVNGMKIPPNTVAFRHANFRSDRPELASDIKQRASGNGSSHKSAQAKKAAKSSVSSHSSRSSSPSEQQAGSPVVRPASASAMHHDAAPVHSISFPTSVPSAFRPVASPAYSSSLLPMAPLLGGGEEEKQSLQPEVDSTGALEYIHSLRQAQQQQLRRLEQERLLREIMLEEEATQQQLRLAQERILRRQLDSVVAPQASHALAAASTLQQQLHPSLLLRPTVPSAASPIQDDVLRRLQAIRQLQSQATADAADSSSSMQS